MQVLTLLQTTIRPQEPTLDAGFLEPGFKPSFADAACEGGLAEALEGSLATALDAFLAA